MNTDILYRYLQNLCSEQEIALVEEKLASDPAFRAELDNLQAIDKAVGNYTYPETDHDAILASITQQETPVKVIKPNFKWMRVAAILVLITGTFLIYKNQVNNTEILTIKADRQGEMFDLPDGSKVWLKNGSELSFEDTKKGAIRKVNLDGVGFFVVKPNHNKKFEVTNGHLKVLVLGTAFEVTDESVSVEHGTVQVTETDKGQELKIEGGQVAMVTESGELQMLELASSEEAGAWRNKALKFKDVELSKVVETLQNHYQITVIFDESLLTQRYTLNFENLDLEGIISVLEAVTDTKVEIANREYRFKM